MMNGLMKNLFLDCSQNSIDTNKKNDNILSCIRARR